MTRPWRASAQIVALCGLLSVVGCSDGEQPTPNIVPTSAPVEERLVPLLYTAETEDFARSASDSFNRIKNTLTDGSLVKLNPLMASPAGVRDFIDKKPTQPLLWLARSSFEVRATKLGLKSENVPELPCSSLFFTAPTLAFRPIDSFAFGSEELPLDPKSLLEASAEDTDTRASLVMGHPLISPSGLSSLAMLASSASGVSVAALTPANVSGSVESFKRVGARVSHQFADDGLMLSWLASREGGLPLLASTTRQQVRSFLARSPQARLEEIPLTQPPFDLDFPLCIFERSQATDQLRQAVRLARGFLMSPHVTEIASAAGFSEKRPARPVEEQISPEALSELVRLRTSFDGDRWVSVVIDTSVAMERALLDAVRKQLAKQLLATDPLPFAASITSCSTTPERLVRSTRSPKIAAGALEKLRTSGGFAFRDCLLQSVESASEKETKAARKTIILITRGRETSSIAALKELKFLVSQRLVRSQAVLYILSIGNELASNAVFDAQARSLGAVVVPTTVSNFSEPLSLLVSELS